MSLIIFVFAFVIVSYSILRLGNFVLADEKKSKYIDSYVNGTVRGLMGLFESSSMLEVKRKRLKRKSSKF